MQLELSNFCKLFDHTLLKADARKEEIEVLCEEARRYSFFGVCVNPHFVALCRSLLQGTDVKVLTVVGFPLGATTSAQKVFEAKSSVEQGAQEIDMVLNIGSLLDGEEQRVAQEIAAVVKAAQVPVKVIIETALLSPQQIEVATRICAQEGAAFVKTSTGFSTRGASIEDINIIRGTLQKINASHVKIKASGGVKSLAQVQEFTRLGVHRIGSSKSVAIVDEFRNINQKNF